MKKTVGKTKAQEKAKRDKYYPKLKLIIEEMGEWEVNGNALSREWEIPTQTINRWKHKIIEELGPLDMSRYGRNIEQSATSNIRLCNRLIRNATTTRDKLLALKVHAELNESFTKFQEAHGKKPKVPEQVVTTELGWEDFNAAYESTYGNKQTKKVGNSAKK